MMVVMHIMRTNNRDCFFISFLHELMSVDSRSLDIQLPLRDLKVLQVPQNSSTAIMEIFVRFLASLATALSFVNDSSIHSIHFRM